MRLAQTARRWLSIVACGPDPNELFAIHGRYQSIAQKQRLIAKTPGWGYEFPDIPEFLKIGTAITSVISVRIPVFIQILAKSFVCGDRTTRQVCSMSAGGCFYENTVEPARQRCTPFSCIGSAGFGSYLPQASPWENAVQVLQTSFTGPLARGLSLVAIVVGGVMFAFGEGQSKRVLAGIIFGVGMAIGAVNFMAWLFP